MAGNLSIRTRLGLQALFIGAVMLCLGLAFIWSQHETDRAFDRILQDEMASAAELRDLELRLLTIHSRMQSVMLAQASPLGALELLKRERKLISQSWANFQHDHRNWLHDPDEDALIADVGGALPALEKFLDRTEAAYRIYDPVELSTLLDRDWFQIQQSLLHNVRTLIDVQEGHVVRATREVEESVRRTRIVVGALLVGGLLFLGIFSVRLGQHIMRRIVDIEEALEAIAGGAEAVSVPYREGETEMERIATAINGTVQQLAADRDAIASLMRRQQAILDSAAEGVYGVDADGRIMFINPAALKILGYEEVDVLGRPSHELLHHHYPDGRPYPLAECPIVSSRRDGQIVRRDDEVLFRKDGSSFPVEYTSAPLADSGGWRGGVVIFHDVTERRRQERLLRDTVTQLRDTNARLAEAQMQLVQAEKLSGLGRLAAGLAHEINNPIGFVQSNFGTLDGYVQDLLELVEAYERFAPDPPDTPEREAVERLRSSMDYDFVRDDIWVLLAETRQGLQRVTRIVADLREFSRIDAPEEWGEVDLRAALESTLKVVASALKGRGEFVRELGDLPPVCGNAAQLNQVFLNLLLNAAHAVEEKGTIAVRTWQEDGLVCVEVADTGCGMEPEVREHMFDPFYTTKPVGQGSGLGLSVAYNIVRNHGGHFDVESTRGQGTMVRLWLPVLNESNCRREVLAR